MGNISTYDVVIVDMLTETSVSILKKVIADINGIPTQIGQNWRRAYVNSPIGRNQISEELAEPYLSAVMAVWGDTPTVEDTEENSESEASE